MQRFLALPAAALLLIPNRPLEAQTPDGAANRTAIDRLEFMVGRWRGEAWMQRGPGERVQTTMTETVERKLNGVVLQVEGLGVIPAAGSSESRVVHHALAIVSFDPQSAAFAMRAYLVNGQAGDFSLTLIPGGVSWSREVSGGRIRNTAHIGNGEWHEVGEFSRDGVTWTQIMEIRLRREH
ncbi:MAG TPA: hypothetical protein VGQ69_06465 [Gemmatimonadales bacterium]|jgi:hypothetical protein|nr:hypothetical protein [Gemmatimonadales bacterium]